MHVQMTSRDETWTAVFSVACVTFPLCNCKQLEMEEGCWGRREGWFTDLLAHAKLLTPVTLGGHIYCLQMCLDLYSILCQSMHQQV